MSYIQAYDFRSFEKNHLKEHQTLFQSVFRRKPELAVLDHDEAAEWDSTDSVLARFHSHEDLIQNLKDGKALLIIPAHVFNHDPLVVLRWGPVRTKIYYCLSIAAVATLLFISIASYGWVGTACWFLGLISASGNGNLVDGLIPQLALIAGLVIALCSLASMATACFLCWLTWLIGSYALALSYEISCDLAYHSATGFKWLHSRNKVKVISSDSCAHEGPKKPVGR